MTLWWLYAILAIAAGITIGCILAITTVGHETEERPGYLDLTGLRCGHCNRPARLGYVLCRRCLRRERRAGRGHYPTAATPLTVRPRRGYSWPPVSRVRAQVPAAPGALRFAPDGFEHLSPDEFAVWQASVLASALNDWPPLASGEAKLWAPDEPRGDEAA